jgi:hypothetical protein
MMSLLFEQPYWIGGIGIVVTIVLFVSWIQSGTIHWLKAAAGTAVITALLLGLNLWILTDRERIQSMLYESAEFLEKNQVEKVRALVHPNATERVKRTAEWIETVKFSRVTITKIHAIEVDRTNNRAEVRLNVVVGGSVGQYSGRGPRWARVRLEERNGNWLVVEIEDGDPTTEYVNTPRVTGILP